MNYKIILKLKRVIWICKHICHCDRFIFYIWLRVFHNSNKSILLTLIKFMFNCSTYYLGPLATQLTAALPFSMRTSSLRCFLDFAWFIQPSNTSPLMTILSRQEYIDLADRWLFVLTWFWTKTKIEHTVEPLGTDTPLLRTVSNVLTKLSYIFF